MFRSELLKLKNSLILSLIAVFTLLELLIIPAYLHWVRGGISLTNMILLTFLIYPLLSAMLSVLSFEQEKEANHFQEIRASIKKRSIWLTKLLVFDLLFFPSAAVWLLSGASIGVALASWLLLIFLNHFHFVLNFLMNRTGNFIVAIVEVLFLIFASNSVLLTAYWCPVVLPVNFVLTQASIHLVIVTVWCVVFIAVLLLVAIRGKNKEA